MGVNNQRPLKDGFVLCVAMFPSIGFLIKNHLLRMSVFMRKNHKIQSTQSILGVGSCRGLNRLILWVESARQRRSVKADELNPITGCLPRFILRCKTNESLCKLCKRLVEQEFIEQGTGRILKKQNFKLLDKLCHFVPRDFSTLQCACGNSSNRGYCPSILEKSSLNWWHEVAQAFLPIQFWAHSIFIKSLIQDYKCPAPCAPFVICRFALVS